VDADGPGAEGLVAGVIEESAGGGEEGGESDAEGAGAAAGSETPAGEDVAG